MMTTPVRIQPRRIPRSGGSGCLAESGALPIVAVIFVVVVVDDERERESESVSDVGKADAWRSCGSQAGHG